MWFFCNLRFFSLGGYVKGLVCVPPFLHTLRNFSRESLPHCRLLAKTCCRVCCCVVTVVCYVSYIVTVLWYYCIVLWLFCIMTVLSCNCTVLWLCCKCPVLLLCYVVLYCVVTPVLWLCCIATVVCCNCTVLQLECILWLWKLTTTDKTWCVAMHTVRYTVRFHIVSLVCSGSPV